MVKTESKYGTSSKNREFVNKNFDQEARENSFFLDGAGERFGSLYASAAGSILRAAERFLDWRAEARSQRHVERGVVHTPPAARLHKSRDG